MQRPTGPDGHCAQCPYVNNMPFGGEKNIGTFKPVEPEDLGLKKNYKEEGPSSVENIDPTDQEKIEAIEEGLKESSVRLENEITEKKGGFFSRDNPLIKKIGLAMSGLVLLGAVDKADAGDVYKTGNEGVDYGKYGQKKVRSFSDPQYRFDEKTSRKYEAGKTETFQVVIKDDNGREKLYNVPKGLADQSKNRDNGRKESLSKISPEPKSNIVAEETWHPAGKSQVASIDRTEVPFKQSKNETSQPKVKPEKFNIEKKHESREQEICDGVLKAYPLLKKSDFWPHHVLNDDQSIAQQLAESLLDENAESKVGAVGTMQNHDAIADTPGFLNGLNKMVIIVDGKRIQPFNLPEIPRVIRYPDSYMKKLSHEKKAAIEQAQKKAYQEQSIMVANIKSMIKGNSDLSRAFGNLHMRNLQMKGIGKAYFDRGDIEQGTEHLLACYNMGEGNYRNIQKEKWPKQTKDYVRNYFRYNGGIKETRKHLSSNSISLGRHEENYFSGKLEKELEYQSSVNKKKTRDRYYGQLANEYSSNKTIKEDNIRAFFPKRGK